MEAELRRLAEDRILQDYSQTSITRAPRASSPMARRDASPMARRAASPMPQARGLAASTGQAPSLAAWGGAGAGQAPLSPRPAGRAEGVMAATEEIKIRAIETYDLPPGAPVGGTPKELLSKVQAVLARPSTADASPKAAGLDRLPSMADTWSAGADSPNKDVLDCGNVDNQLRDLRAHVDTQAKLQHQRMAAYDTERKLIKDMLTEFQDKAAADIQQMRDMLVEQKEKTLTEQQLQIKELRDMVGDRATELTQMRDMLSVTQVKGPSDAKQQELLSIELRQLCDKLAEQATVQHNFESFCITEQQKASKEIKDLRDALAEQPVILDGELKLFRDSAKGQDELSTAMISRFNTLQEQINEVRAHSSTVEVHFLEFKQGWEAIQEQTGGSGMQEQLAQQAKFIAELQHGFVSLQHLQKEASQAGAAEAMKSVVSLEADLRSLRDVCDRQNAELEHKQNALSKEFHNLEPQFEDRLQMTRSSAELAEAEGNKLRSSLEMKLRHQEQVVAALREQVTSVAEKAEQMLEKPSGVGDAKHLKAEMLDEVGDLKREIASHKSVQASELKQEADALHSHVHKVVTAEREARTQEVARFQKMLTAVREELTELVEDLRKSVRMAVASVGGTMNVDVTRASPMDVTCAAPAPP